ncbi:hypothetical protein [Natrinema altunense]|uniref:hypothetical protein n=1 Tax=Natrinema altunense TaxID=222984 RepID=UPI0011869CF7|nr:hypothetical protein [Natrinema altunense]
MDESPKKVEKGRRSAIKTLGAGALAGVFVPKSVRGKSNSDNLLERSLILREEEGWPVDKWREYLIKHGADVYSASGKLQVPLNNADDKAHVEELERSWITITLTYSENLGSDDYIDLSWQWEYYTPDAPIPLDLVKIGWSDNDYVRSGEPWYGSYVSEITDKDSEFNTGFVAEYDSSEQEQSTLPYNPAPGEDKTIYGSGCGMPVKTKDTDPSKRRIEFDYYHTWEETTYDISVGPNGPVVNPGSETAQWVAEDGALETEIRDGKEFNWDNA